MKTITLLRSKESSLLRRHQWVFSGAIAKSSISPAEGELVRVAAHDGSFLGIGHWHGGSIAVRVLTFEDEPIGERFWASRLSDALAVRARAGLPSEVTDAFRLIHAEGDGLPGLVVDIYGTTAVIQAHSLGMAHSAEDIAKALSGLSGLLLSTILLRDLTSSTMRFIQGDNPEGLIRENGLQFRVNWAQGQKTGFFLDQRENRALLGRLSKGRTVLNTFSYTGGFSAYALRGGAERVVSVDISGNAIALAEANVGLNGKFAKRHEAVAQDAFKYLERAEGFDLIILDPPAFAKGMKARHQAVQGYKRLNETAFRRIEPGGLVMTFSCSQVVSAPLFEGAVLAAAINAGRQVRVLQRLGHGPDHPVSIYHPEGEYLKGLLLHVS